MFERDSGLYESVYEKQEAPTQGRNEAFSALVARTLMIRQSKNNVDYTKLFSIVQAMILNTIPMMDYSATAEISGKTIEGTTVTVDNSTFNLTGLKAPELIKEILGLGTMVADLGPGIFGNQFTHNSPKEHYVIAALGEIFRLKIELNKGRGGDLDNRIQNWETLLGKKLFFKLRLESNL